MFIAILTTNIMSVHDHILVKRDLDQLLGAQNWSIDLGDDEKILRIAIQSNILPILYETLAMCSVKVSLLNIYHRDYGIDFPLLPNEKGTAGQSFVSYALSIRFFFCV